jgi:hypothetical protein
VIIGGPVRAEALPARFRRRVIDLGISEQAIHVWRRQHLIDTGRLSGTTTAENAELRAAKRRIAELETEFAIHRRMGAQDGRRGYCPNWAPSPARCTRPATPPDSTTEPTPPL